MITYVSGNIFESPARVLVNPVNTVGVMGKGLAKEFKTIYPEMFKEYQHYCETGLLDIGRLWIYKTDHKWILNFPTKKNWRSPSKHEYIEAGLKKFISTYAQKGITSISFPLLGCGNGELDWETDVHPLMKKYLNKLPIDIYIHLLNSKAIKAEHKNIEEIKLWLRSEPQSLAFSEVWEDLTELLDKHEMFVTLDTKEEFRAYITNCTLHVIHGKGIYKISKEELWGLWQHMRSMGYCIKSSMPYGLERYSSYIFSVFSELPYISSIYITSNYNEINKAPSLGLQYKAPINSLGNLFTPIEVFEVI